MGQNSEYAQIQGSQHLSFADTPPPSFEGYAKTTSVIPTSSSIEPSFSPLMLKQMQTMIDGALNGAIDRRLTVLGVNFSTPKS